MRTICSQEMFTKKCWQQQNLNSDPKEVWHYYNHATFTPTAKNFMLYCRLIYIHAICWTYDQSKGGDTRELQSRMVPHKITGSSHLKGPENLRIFLFVMVLLGATLKSSL